MPRASAKLALIPLLVAFSGCGGNTNTLPTDASTAEYAKQSQDKLAGMYGVPKAEKAKSNNAADLMNKMYKK